MSAARRLLALGRLAGVLTTVAYAASGAGAAPALAADPLAHVAFAVADETLFDAPSTGAGSRDRGSWRVDRGEFVNGQINLHVEIDTLPPSMPVTSGPAVLFAGLSLYGDAGGDVAIEKTVGPVAHVLAPACASDADCHYSIDIAIPTSRLPAAIAGLEQHGKLIWVSANLTLVRTFASGQWLQVLPFEQGEGLTTDGPAGRLGAMTATHGFLQPAGLFPASQAEAIPKGNWDLEDGLDYPAIVEHLRSEAGDRSSSVPVVTLAIHVRFDPTCPSDLELFLHDDLGNHLFSTWTDAGIPRLDATSAMPIGSPWFLSVDGGDGTPNATVRLGPIIAGGSPVVLEATMDCIGRTGTLNLAGATTATPIPTAPAPSIIARPVPTAIVTDDPGTTGRSPSDTKAPAATPFVLFAAVALVIGMALAAGGIRRRRGRS